MNNQEYKLLIVDDEPDIVEFLSYNLKRERFAIYSATNGKSAIELAAKINPHLILLDVMIPEMDGIETCEKLGEISSLDRTLITFLTARGEDYSQVAGFEAGGDDYINKPIKPKVLVSCIRALLKRVNWKTDNETTTGGQIKTGDFIIDREKYFIFCGLSIFTLSEFINLHFDHYSKHPSDSKSEKASV
ncbi:MAG: response regulator transcription factor [Candidatus Delongbacteria bacterium]|nr:response regulator transcription factor [Candidatus Delongbacteria bacterium]MBN2821082.1 response regulator transcription factor [Bacteroidales bacterium]